MQFLFFEPTRRMVSIKLRRNYHQHFGIEVQKTVSPLVMTQATGGGQRWALTRVDVFRQEEIEKVAQKNSTLFLPARNH